MDVNLSSDKLLDAADALNFLSSQNTYAEAIAGSVATGKTTASLDGSFVVAVTNNTVKAMLGDNVTIKANVGGADITVLDGATTRVIAGSLSAAPAKASVGATVAVLVNSDTAAVEAGNRLNVQSQDNLNISAEQTGDAQAFTAALAVAAGTEAKAAVGGAINVIVNKSAARVDIGDSLTLKALNADGSVDVRSKARYDLMLISGNANVTALKGSVAAGGVVNVIVDKTEARTTLGKNADIAAGKDLSVTSDVSDQMISGALSASAGLSVNGKSGAGAVNVIVSRSAADTTVGEKANLTATAGDLAVKAGNDAWMLNASLAAAGSMKTAIGGSFNVNVFDRQATVNLTDGTLKAGGNLALQSSGRDSNIVAGLAVAGSVSGTSVSGNSQVLVESSRIHTNIAKGVTAAAGKNALIEAYYSDFTVDAAGSIVASGTGSAFGVTGAVTVNTDATLEVAESGTATIDGALTLAEGAALAFNFTEKAAAPVLAVATPATFPETVNVKVSAAGGLRPSAGQYTLTSGGAFTGANVSLAADAPKWVKRVSVNDDGDIVLKVKFRGVAIFVK